MATMVADNEIPKVAIVGRPNVGKSSLFNRIVGKRVAVVYKEGGTTRDYVMRKVTIEGADFFLIDTGGFVFGKQDEMTKLIRQQIKRAIEEADILLFMCDGKTGLLPQDLEFASLLRKAKKACYLVVNKIDNPSMEEELYEFYKLGLGRPYPISAIHNRGIKQLLLDITSGLKDKTKTKPSIQDYISIAIVGRPNVGKSSFLNQLLKEERVIVHKNPGTTRDLIDTYFQYKGQDMVLIDTAGIRHRRKIKDAPDVYSSLRSKEAIKQSVVSLFLIDGYEGITSDDLRILDIILEEGKGCILCVNKWDLVKNITQEKYKDLIYKRSGFFKYTPIIFISALTGRNIYKPFDLVPGIVSNTNIKVPTPKLNAFLQDIKRTHPFISSAQKLKIRYIVQEDIMPPSFLCFCNNPNYVTETFINYLENSLRGEFGFFGTPLKFRFVKSKS